MFGEKPLLWVITLILLAACATSPAGGRKSPYAPDEVLAPVGTSSMDAAKVNGLVREINERNRTVEDDAEWIKESYSGLLVRRLSNISPREYVDFREYLDDGAVYVLVHPAYFPFFHYPKKLEGGAGSKKNVIESLLSLEPPDRKFEVLQAQERRTRDFIEFKSTQGKLLILVVPKNYGKYAGYTYKEGSDEYMRYLNEVTNFSKSVVFVESRSPNRGYLTDDDALRLMEFILSLNAKKVYIGGGYVGRCLEDFYALLIEDFGKEGIFVVPELSDISPRELNNSLTKAILTPDGRINTKTATEYMRSDFFGIQKVKPEVINLR